MISGAYCRAPLGLRSAHVRLIAPVVLTPSRPEGLSLWRKGVRTQRNLERPRDRRPTRDEGYPMAIRNDGVRIALVAALVILAAACNGRDMRSSSAMPTDLSPEGVKAADNFLWLEDVDGERALAWVKEQNDKTAAVLEADPRYQAFKQEALDVLTAKDRIPAPGFRDGGIDNFWQDESHVRGLWRHTSRESYMSDAPTWETVLDIDALARDEGANWIWKGVDCLEPQESRCLVSLSDGGKDAVVVREYDVATGAFVDGGFNLPEGKHRVAWLDADTLLIATDFGGNSLTESGYPFVVKSLKRGQTLDQATEVYRGDARDGGYGVSPAVYRDGSGRVLSVIITRPLDTFRSETWELVEGKPVKLNLPERVSVQGMTSDRLVFTIEEPWGGREPGDLLAVKPSMLRKVAEDVGGDAVVFAPGDRQTVDEVRVFDDRIVAAIYDNVRGQVVVFRDAGDGVWRQDILPVPANSSVHLGALSRSSGELFYSYEGFLEPPTLALAEIQTSHADIVKQSPARFIAASDIVEQFEATSGDGTKIPYFVARPVDAPADGSTPTLLYGYGGFLVSKPAVYLPEMGKLWLERGGAYVIANIRGGGEFGPDWHQAALKENRQRAFDDFAAVAKDLVHRGITSPDHLAIYGRSNGGVLTSVTLTQHPELIGGAVIESPLVDMLRYQDLPPGASWIGEYGDPRIPEEASYIAAYSGYQNIRPDMNYPEVYITTNTHDDRVHPGHARKFAARLQAYGYPALYFEETNGGHSNDADPILNAQRWARHYVYLARRLGLKAE
ncbi:MAG: prolyl oligopeptidase family serine peptidase [Hyphomonadaceae bacterium]